MALMFDWVFPLKFFTVLMLLVSMNVSANFGVKQMTFYEQAEKAEFIALVRLLKIEHHVNSYKEKVLVVEVVDGILNLNKGDQIRLLAQGNLLGIDIGFDELGSKAIIFMDMILPPLKYQGFYRTTSVNNSVYHLKNNLVSGYGLPSMSLEKVAMEIRKVRDKRNWFE